VRLFEDDSALSDFQFSSDKPLTMQSGSHGRLYAQVDLSSPVRISIMKMGFIPQQVSVDCAGELDRREYEVKLKRIQ